jgi:NADPH:quinone reductase-like Zn-dependent oxidoreductase
LKLRHNSSRGKRIGLNIAERSTYGEKEMKAMQAARVIDTGKTTEVEMAEMVTPIAGEGEVLVQVYAAGITPSELLWYPTSHNREGGVRTHAIPGHEFSGVVAAVGKGVEKFAVGQEVFGMNDWFLDGATAEFCVTVPSNIAPKPAHLSHAEAAAVPIGALTASQGLFDRAKLGAGERLLVHGAAGAVGVFVVQLAKLYGAEVIATASARNRDFLLELGATEVLDYQKDAFEQLIRDVDVVFDTVGGATLERSWDVLKPDGRLVTIAASSEGTSDGRTKDAFFIVEPKRSELIKIAELFDAGKLRSFVDAQIPLSEAPAAYAGKVERKHGYGKVVVVMPSYH